MMRWLGAMSFRRAAKLAFAWPVLVLLAAGGVIVFAYGYLAVGAGRLPHPNDLTVRISIGSWIPVATLLAVPPIIFLALWWLVRGRRAV